MKKYLGLCAMFVLLSAGFAAAATLTPDASKSGGTVVGTGKATVDIVKFSTGVYGGAEFSATGYAVDTYHKSGTKAYGTAYDATALYFKDLGTGATLTAPASSVAEEAFPTGEWTKM